MEYVTFTKTDDGNLRIELTADGREELRERKELRADLYEHGYNRWPSDLDIFYELIEHELCNGWESVTSEDIGALTSNPYMLADDTDRDDMGELQRCGTVYAFDAYQIREPLDDLERDGVVIFRGYSDE